MTAEETSMTHVVCVPVDTGRQVAGGWGRAHRLAVATVSAGRIVDWAEHDVHWDTLHDSGAEGAHHARVARFLIEHHVGVVVAAHMGPPMARMIGAMGLRSILGARGDAEAAVLGAAQA